MSHEEADAALLARASSYAGFRTLAELTVKNLRQISALEGVDFATALLYDRVRRVERNAAFVEQINRLQADHDRTIAEALIKETIVAIVPAALYKEKPHTGADGRVVRAAAGQIGLKCELVPTGSTGTLAENSHIILDWLQAHRDERVILVSLCKGGADVKVALNISGVEKRFANVRAWVNIAGTLSGSALAEWLLATKMRSFATWLFLKTGGHDLAFLEEIIRLPSKVLSAPLHIPPNLQMINIVGFPLRQHLSNGFMRRCHKILSYEGPNDGGVLLADVCHLPGFAYPVWGADHYLRPDCRAGRMIASIFEWIVSAPTEPKPAHSREGLFPAN